MQYIFVLISWLNLIGLRWKRGIIRKSKWNRAWKKKSLTTIEHVIMEIHMYVVDSDNVDYIQRKNHEWTWKFCRELHTISTFHLKLQNISWIKHFYLGCDYVFQSTPGSFNFWLNHIENQHPKVAEIFWRWRSISFDFDRTIHVFILENIRNEFQSYLGCLM